MLDYTNSEESGVLLINPLVVPLSWIRFDPICNYKNPICGKKTPFEPPEPFARSYTEDLNRMNTARAVRKILEETLECMEPPNGIKLSEYKKNVLSKLPLMVNLYDLDC